MSRRGRNALKVLKDFAAWNKLGGGKVTQVTVEVTPDTMKTYLRMEGQRFKKGQPISYGGLTVNCIGSREWRERRTWEQTGQVA